MCPPTPMSEHPTPSAARRISGTANPRGPTSARLPSPAGDEPEPENRQGGDDLT